MCSGEAVGVFSAQKIPCLQSGLIRKISSLFTDHQKKSSSSFKKQKCSLRWSFDIIFFWHEWHNEIGVNDKLFRALSLLWLCLTWLLSTLKLKHVVGGNRTKNNIKCWNFPHRIDFFYSKNLDSFVSLCVYNACFFSLNFFFSEHFKSLVSIYCMWSMLRVICDTCCVQFSYYIVVRHIESVENRK